MKPNKMTNFKTILILLIITIACTVFIISPTIFSKHLRIHIQEILHTKETSGIDNHLRQTALYQGTAAPDRRVEPLVPLLQATNNVTTFVEGEDELWRTIAAIHNNSFTPARSEKCTYRLPGCIIVGTYKAGTTELIEFMAMHPNIVIKRKPMYQINFFSNEQRYQKMIEWYRQEMPCAYRSQIVVEKSPDYFTNAKAPRRIHQMNPDIKLIALFREPVSRALSFCTFMLQIPQCDLRQFGFVNNSNKSHFNGRFINSSIYDEELARYYSMFNRSQLLIINHKDFVRNPYLILSRVEAFLELEPFIKPDHFAFNKVKQFNCVSANTTTAACYGARRGRSGVKPDNRTVAELNKLFEPHNERFFQLLGYRMDW